MQRNRRKQICTIEEDMIIEEMKSYIERRRITTLCSSISKKEIFDEKEYRYVCVFTYFILKYHVFLMLTVG